MTVFVYDHTFEGLLTALFEAYNRRVFPDGLAAEGEPLPLFCETQFQVVTDEAKAQRVWRGLEKKLTQGGLRAVRYCWLSELPDSDYLLLRFMQQVMDSRQNIEGDFGRAEVLEVTQTAKKVSYEAHRILQFARFQKAVDGTYFASMEPIYNVMPLAIDHFTDRFSIHSFVLYDLKRDYGYHYNGHTTTQFSFAPGGRLLTPDGCLPEQLMDQHEKLFQDLWRAYFKAICIKERLNPRKHRQDMPVRFWKHLTEKN